MQKKAQKTEYFLHKLQNSAAELPKKKKINPEN